MQTSITSQNGGARNAHLIAWDDPTPERNVCPALRLRRTTFGRKVLDRSRRRDRVERHVHDGGKSPRRCRTRTRPEALPVRPPRFVEVHVRTVRTPKRSMLVKQRYMGTSREANDVLDKSREEILVPYIYPVTVVVRDVRIVCSNVSSLADVDYLSCLC